MICAGACSLMIADALRFFPAMPDEPLIFVEVALTEGTNSIQKFFWKSRCDRRWQGWYSCILFDFNRQAGLAGITFGNSLIKTVVHHLLRELPQIEILWRFHQSRMKMVEWTGLFDANANSETQMKLAASYLLNAKTSLANRVMRWHGFILTMGRLLPPFTLTRIPQKWHSAIMWGVVNYRYDLSLSVNTMALPTKPYLKRLWSACREIDLADPIV